MNPYNSHNSQFLSSEELRDLGVKCGERCFVHWSCVLIGCDRIELGDDVRIDAYCQLSAGAEGFIKIGDKTHIASHVLIMGATGVTIGKGVGLAAGTKVYTSSDSFNGGGLIGPQHLLQHRKLFNAAVIMEDFTATGANTVVLAGSHMKLGAVAHTNSVVRGELEPLGIYKGFPAEKIGVRKPTFLGYVSFEYPQYPLEELLPYKYGENQGSGEELPERKTSPTEADNIAESGFPVVHPLECKIDCHQKQADSQNHGATSNLVDLKKRKTHKPL